MLRLEVVELFIKTRLLEPSALLIMPALELDVQRLKRKNMMHRPEFRVDHADKPREPESRTPLLSARYEQG